MKLIHFGQRVIDELRTRRGFHLLVVILRILIGFALLPSGLKKVLGEPFTDPNNAGPFHDFLDAFLATGVFYHWVGVTQLLTALLLLTQRQALVGALMALPIFSTILVFCWSTAVYPTASIVTLITLGVVFLVLWDYRRWWRIFATSELPAPADEMSVDLRLWTRCGLGIIAVYTVACLLEGGIYRPRKLELHEPSFWVFPVLVTLPIITGLIERRALRSSRGSSTSPSRRAP